MLMMDLPAASAVVEFGVATAEVGVPTTGCLPLKTDLEDARLQRLRSSTLQLRLWNAGEDGDFAKSTIVIGNHPCVKPTVAAELDDLVGIGLEDRGNDEVIEPGLSGIDALGHGTERLI